MIGAAQPLALPFCPLEPRFGVLRDFYRFGVEVLLGVALELHSVASQEVEVVDRLLDALAGEAVEPPEVNEVERALPGLLKHVVKLEAPVTSLASRLVVLTLPHHLSAAPVAGGAELDELVLDLPLLVVGRAAGVKSNARRPLVHLPDVPQTSVYGTVFF